MAIGKPQEEVEAIKHFRKNGAFEVLSKATITNLDDSKLTSIIHGDFWNNNIFFSMDKSTVSFIDFQYLVVGHPGRDFWNYIYTCTDLQWRKAHLEDCLRAYFEVYDVYLKQAGIDMDFEEFKADMHKYRGFGLAMAPFLLPLVMNPGKPDVMQSWKSSQRMLKIMYEQFSCPPKEDELPIFKEINQRLIDMYGEAFELGILTKC